MSMSNSRGPRQFVRSISVGVGLGVSLPAANGQDCSGTFFSWNPPTTATAAGTASAPAIDTLFSRKGDSVSYLAQGGSLLAVRNISDRSDPGGSIKWTWKTPSGMPIPNSPNVVPLSKHGEFVFVGAEDGFLYKVNADDGSTRNLSRDTRRRIRSTVVCSADALPSTPAVQLYNFADATYRSAAQAAGHKGDDLVFVMTRNGCGDSTHNRVIAYWASDLELAWEFNADGLHNVDGLGSEGCSIDYTTNILYCGTSLPSGAIQDSLLALDTTTGALKWSHNAGPIISRPMVNYGRLYVVNEAGALSAYDPAGNGFGGAAPLWASPVPVATPGSIIEKSLWPVGDSLLIVDSAGVLRRIRDLGTVATILWESAAEAGVQFITKPVAVESLNKIFLGRNDGKVQQLNLPDGEPEGVVTVSEGFDVYDPSLDIEGPALDFNRLVVAATTNGSGNVTRLTLPLCLQPPT